MLLHHNGLYHSLGSLAPAYEEDLVDYFGGVGRIPIEILRVLSGSAQCFKENKARWEENGAAAYCSLDPSRNAQILETHLLRQLGHQEV